MLLLLVVIAGAALVAIFAIAALRPRAARPVRPAVSRERVQAEKAQRDPALEARIAMALDAPREKYGEIFLTYHVWKSDRETRLELFAADPWAKLNEFTRCLVVRYLWRILESVSAGSVVVVDAPSQRWSRAFDATFRDHGIDPWPLRPSYAPAPQFIKDP